MDNQTAKEMYQRASSLFAKGQYSEALELLNKLATAFPNNEQVAQARAKCQAAHRQQNAMPESPAQKMAMSHQEPKVPFYRAISVLVAATIGILLAGFALSQWYGVTTPNERQVVSSSSPDSAAVVFTFDEPISPPDKERYSKFEKVAWYEGSVYLDGSYLHNIARDGYRALLDVPILETGRTTLGLVFYPLDFEQYNHLICFGSDSRALVLRKNNGALELSAGNFAFTQPLPELEVISGQWNTAVLTIDIGKRKIGIMLNGTEAKTFSIPAEANIERYRKERNISLVNTGTAETFKGYWDEISISPGTFGSEQMQELHDALANASRRAVMPDRPEGWSRVVATVIPLLDLDGAKTIALPDNLFIGTLYDRDNAAPDAGWKELCEAKGQIALPENRELKFVHYGWVPDHGMRHVSDVEFGDARIAYVTSIPGLRDLVLRKAELSDAGMNEIAKVKGLRKLDVSENTIGDQGLTQLAEIAELEELNLANTQVTDAGIAKIAEMESLRNIVLANTSISDSALAVLGEMPSLETLVVSGTQVADKGLTELSGLKKLTGLVLDNTGVTNSGLKAVSTLQNLRVLSLANTQIDDSGITALGGLTNLQELSLAATKVTNACTSHLGNLQGLKILHLGGTQIDGEGLANLSGLGKLEELTLYPFTDDTLAHLASFKHLKNLELAGQPITDAGLKHLGEATDFEMLDLSRTEVSDVGLGYLRENSNVRELRLGWTSSITDQGVAHIAGFKSLEVLVLAGTQVTDSGLKHVKELSNLRELSLWTTAVTDAGIADLTGLADLEKLQLPHTKITDAAVGHLSKMKSLRELTLPDDIISNEAVARLKKALPDCRM